MPATTIDTVAAAFVTAIAAVTPRMQEGRTVRTWKNYEGDRPPSADARWFRLDWDTEGHTPGGWFGRTGSSSTSWVETEYTLTIWVDYGGLPRHRSKVLADDDLYQLRDILNRLKSTVDGLRWVEAIDWAYSPASTDPNQAQVLLQYRVQIMKARA